MDTHLKCLAKALISTNKMGFHAEITIISWLDWKSILSITNYHDIQPNYRTVHLGFSLLLEKLIVNYTPGPSCSKLMMSLVNDSLKFTLSDTQLHVC